jgi:hypothetical protein
LIGPVEEERNLARAREHCPHLDTRTGHVTEFTKILTGLHGDRWDDWFAAVDADDQTDLHSFAYGIKRDQQAVLGRLSARTGFILGHGCFRHAV